jgi:Family of unknown function (DUF5678)
METAVNLTSAGADWAIDDRELAKLYPGKYVVAIPKVVIAVGDDPNAVLAEASAKLGLPVTEIVLTGIAALENRPLFDWY